MIARAACGLGIGLVAGLVGTAAITLSQVIVMRIQGRKPSMSPVKAVSQVFGFRPVDPAAEARLNQLAHWGYGTSWGSVRGLMTVFGLRGPWADALHFGAVQGTAFVMLPGLKVAPPVRDWGGTEIALEAMHHVVYVTAAGLTSDYLCRSLASERESAPSAWPWLAAGLAAQRLLGRPTSRAPLRAIPAAQQVREAVSRLPLGV